MRQVSVEFFDWKVHGSPFSGEKWPARNAVVDPAARRLKLVQITDLSGLPHTWEVASTERNPQGTFLVNLFAKISVLDGVNPDLGAVIGAWRHAQKKAVEAFVAFSKISGRARAQRGGNFGEQLIVIRIRLLKHADVALAAGNVNSFSAGIVINVVGVLHARELCHRAASVGVENCEARRLVRGHKEAVIR